MGIKKRVKETGMIKYAKSAVAIIAVTSLAAAILAANKQTSAPPTLIRLQANGDTLAEVRLLKPTQLKLKGDSTERDASTGRTIASNAVVEIATRGQPITIRAERVELLSETK
jgi:hypothetical protein